MSKEYSPGQELGPNEKFDHDTKGLDDTPRYSAQPDADDVESNAPAPLKRALESRHMQMIAIVSLS